MKKILYIEDEESNRELMKDIIKRLEYDFDSVSSAEEGLNIINKEDVSLIILDLKLSGKMQGRDLLKKLKDAGFKNKVIVLTASLKTVKSEMRKDFPGLVSACILKPFDYKELVTKIKKTLNISNK